MEVARNRFSFVFFLGSLILNGCVADGETATCAIKGFHLSSASMDLEPVTIDSVHFANGKTLWMLNGVLHTSGQSNDFQLLFHEDPLKVLPHAFHSKAPLTFSGKDSVECIITRNYNVFEITWRTNRQRIYLKTGVISER